jgi:nicotinamide riboside kinase
VIFDTNPLQSLVYYEHYFSARRPLWLERILAQRHYDLYLLLEVDVPWVADAQRDRPRFRRGFYRLFHQALRGRQLPFVRIHGTWEERRQQAIGAIDRLRSASA